MLDYTGRPLPDDILPDQIVEDEDDNMRIVSEELLLGGDDETGEGLLRENELALENLENDAPCSDVSPDITEFESL